MRATTCIECGEVYTPKPKGYNAKYCTGKCKRRNQRKRLRSLNPAQLKDARKRSYAQTRKHPNRMQKHQASAARYRKATRLWLSEYKLAHGCNDCGYKENAAALQLDHEGKKSIEISDARSSIKRLLEEIVKGKCVVRCANCHSIKTWERKQKNENS